MTLRARVWLGLGVVLLVVVAMGVLVWRTLDDVDRARAGATGQLYPAAQEAGQLLAGVSDAESGLWGYAITEDTTSLTQYLSGELLADGSLATLDALLTGPLADLRPLFDQAAEEWALWHNDIASAQIDQIAAGQAAAVRKAIAEGDGARVLGRLRTDASLLQQALEERTSAEVAAVSEATSRLALALMATGALALAIAGAAAFGLSRWVLRPLADLGGQMRRIARDNDLVTPLEPSGPPEVADAGRDAELLRQHLADRAAAALQANEGLAQEGPTVSALRTYLVGGEVRRIPGYGLGTASLSAEGALSADFWDVAPMADEDRSAVVMCDVSGHDTAAALVAAHFKTALRLVLGGGLSEQAALSSAATLLSDFPSHFASCLLVGFGPDGVRWLNAGHEPPLLIRAGGGSEGRRSSAGGDRRSSGSGDRRASGSGDRRAAAAEDKPRGEESKGERAAGGAERARGGRVERLRTTGPVVSTLGGTWTIARTELEPGDIVVMYTDGLAEARSEDGEEVGDERLAEWATALAAQSRSDEPAERASYIAQGLLDRSRSFAGDRRRDDSTVLVVVRE